MEGRVAGVVTTSTSMTHLLAQHTLAHTPVLSRALCVVRTPGVEPGSQAWEACMIPLHYMRFRNRKWLGCHRGHAIPVWRHAIYRVWRHVAWSV